VADLPDPGPRENEVLVAVRASSVNPLDFKMRAGSLRLLVGSHVPRITGADFAGEVVAAGAGVGVFRPGERVFGFTNAFARQQGAHAERVAVPARQMRLIPRSLSFEEAAALPCVALTAISGLLNAAPLEGRRVLVNGAGGGVGHLAIGIARAHGARVTARTSGRNFDLVRQLGAEGVLAREAGPLAAAGAVFDVIYDAWGHLAFGDASPVLARGGALVTTLPGASLGLRALLARLFGGKRVFFSNLLGRDEHWTELIRLVEERGLKPHIGGTFCLDDAAKAMAVVEAGGVSGKIVIRIP
jgi:NADPH:quinone reductase-like Zn-dependent oxidoreductase